MIWRNFCSFLKCYLILTIWIVFVEDGKGIVRKVSTVLILEINEEEKKIHYGTGCIFFFFLIPLDVKTEICYFDRKEKHFLSFLCQESSSKSLSGESNVYRKAVPVRSIQLAYLCHLVLCALVFSDYRLVSVL